MGEIDHRVKGSISIVLPNAISVGKEQSQPRTTLWVLNLSISGSRKEEIYDCHKEERSHPSFFFLIFTYADLYVKINLLMLQS